MVPLLKPRYCSLAGADRAGEPLRLLGLQRLRDQRGDRVAAGARTGSRATGHVRPIKIGSGRARIPTIKYTSICLRICFIISPVGFKGNRFHYRTQLLQNGSN